MCGYLHATRPLYPEGKAVRKNWVGVWVGSRVCLDLSAGKELPAAGKIVE